MAWPPEISAQGGLANEVELQSLPAADILESPQANRLTEGADPASAEPNSSEGLKGNSDQNTAAMELESLQPACADMATAPISSPLPHRNIEISASARGSASISEEPNGSIQVGPSDEQDAAARELETLQPPCPELATSAGASHLLPPKIEVGGSPGIGHCDSLSPSPNGRDADGRRVRRKSRKFLEAYPEGMVKGRTSSDGAKLRASGSAAPDYLGPLKLSTEGQNCLSLKSEAEGASADRNGDVKAGMGTENGGQRAKRRKLSAR